MLNAPPKSLRATQGHGSREWSIVLKVGGRKVTATEDGSDKQMPSCGYYQREVSQVIRGNIVRGRGYLIFISVPKLNAA